MEVAITPNATTIFNNYYLTYFFPILFFFVYAFKMLSYMHIFSVHSTL